MARAHGTGSEQELLVPVVVAMKDFLAERSVIAADAGYHSEANLQQLATMQVTALIADNDMRRRDARFATQHRHKEAPDPLHDKSEPEQVSAVYQASDFTYDAGARTCIHLHLPGGQIPQPERPPPLCAPSCFAGARPRRCPKRRPHE